jgi:hypothetical protein
MSFHGIPGKPHQQDHSQRPVSRPAAPRETHVARMSSTSVDEGRVPDVGFRMGGIIAVRAW